ncbi:MAG: hypothetical protein IJX69_04280 [Oscillospiraceae bacterium]|nr:hypothetical protein [Oscillospiraceae bacterium]
MRKMLAILILGAIILLTIIGCGGQKGYSLQYDASMIERIDIAEVFDNPDSASQLLAEYEVLYTLDAEEVPTLIGRLENMKPREYWNDPAECIRDYAIMVHYDNGTTEILSSTGCGLFRGNTGDYNRYYFDDDEFQALIVPYLSN